MKISATNLEPLTSVYSNPSTSDSFIVVIPKTPLYPPIRNEAMTTRSLIQIDLPQVTGTLTGGLPITAYKLEWNSGGPDDLFTSIFEGPGTSFT